MNNVKPKQIKYIVKMKRTLQFLIFLMLVQMGARGQTDDQDDNQSSKEKVYRWSLDVNADGKVSIADLVSLTQYRIDGTKGVRLLLANGTERYSCDFNNDGVVNQSDIDILVDAILNGKMGEQLELLSIEITPGGDASGGGLPPLDTKKR